MALTANGVGEHLIIDAWGAKKLDDPQLMRRVLIEMAAAAKARLLRVFIHSFGHGNGVTGVALLAESHISVHTWPEHEYAAFDIFVCGAANSSESVGLVKKYFAPDRIEEQLMYRGSSKRP